MQLVKSNLNLKWRQFMLFCVQLGKKHFSTASHNKKYLFHSRVWSGFVHSRGLGVDLTYAASLYKILSTTVVIPFLITNFYTPNVFGREIKYLTQLQT